MKNPELKKVLIYLSEYLYKGFKKFLEPNSFYSKTTSLHRCLELGWQKWVFFLLISENISCFGGGWLNLVLFLVLSCFQPKQRIICVISKVSLPSMLGFRECRFRRWLGKSDAGAGSLLEVQGLPPWQFWKLVRCSGTCCSPFPQWASGTPPSLARTWVGCAKCFWAALNSLLK